jgi:hypothetical protein
VSLHFRVCESVACFIGRHLSFSAGTSLTVAMATAHVAWRRFAPVYPLRVVALSELPAMHPVSVTELLACKFGGKCAACAASES